MESQVGVELELRKLFKSGNVVEEVGFPAASSKVTEIDYLKIIDISK